MNYQAEAIQTKSTSFHGELVSRSHLLDVLQNVVEGLKELDVLKKALFYGKKEGLTNPQYQINKNCNMLQIHNLADNPQDGIDTFHAMIGMATEAGEMLEALLSCIDPSIEQPLDRTNVIEETGDMNWYMAVLAEAQGFSLEQAQYVNIEKLRKRYPQKFTEYDAINRNLEVERKELEATPIEKFMRAEREEILKVKVRLVPPCPIQNIGPDSK